MKRGRALAVLGMLLFAAPVAAQDAIEVESITPRGFGYFVGDRLHYRARITAPPGYALEPASLPQAGALDYWLELGAVGVREADGTVEIDLDYHTFYVPLEPSERIIPPINLTFANSENDETRQVTLPAWTFVMSPLRPILERSSPQVMRPDTLSSAIDTRPRQWLAGGGWAAAILSLLFLLWYRGIGPFRPSPAHPFRRASRQIARLAPTKADNTYGESLTALHRALDATFGRRLLASDLNRFIDQVPRFADMHDELASFFAASRLYFFADQADDAAAIVPPAMLAPLARQLASRERAP